MRELWPLVNSPMIFTNTNIVHSIYLRNSNCVIQVCSGFLTLVRLFLNASDHIHIFHHFFKSGWFLFLRLHLRQCLILPPSEHL